ncbi:uncharacterized protein MYCFIDRAFT_175330 [Pseudocercospora fijiensis CIRAD86]|uniref:Uncharacterized protein n=1 Tax=Pseudocercospora fijiensis (strain CIRAD86) TaxID=383855 RepID=M3AWC6_PSEFD|nr:uncharacterized protein MYCFIDRAFT_175330 [Pseudocercospora fijiensis CIRAD86]EME81752.1 hypothetical protein MYCFIDRAFT_175330 [Pseudocercospora fijiensis CIRAD86]
MTKLISGSYDTYMSCQSGLCTQLLRHLDQNAAVRCGAVRCGAVRCVPAHCTMPRNHALEQDPDEMSPSPAIASSPRARPGSMILHIARILFLTTAKYNNLLQTAASGRSLPSTRQLACVKTSRYLAGTPCVSAGGAVMKDCHRTVLGTSGPLDECWHPTNRPSATSTTGKLLRPGCSIMNHESEQQQYSSRLIVSRRTDCQESLPRLVRTANDSGKASARALGFCASDFTMLQARAGISRMLTLGKRENILLADHVDAQPCWQYKYRKDESFSFIMLHNKSIDEGEQQSTWQRIPQIGKDAELDDYREVISEMGEGPQKRTASGSNAAFNQFEQGTIARINHFCELATSQKDVNNSDATTDWEVSMILLQLTLYERKSGI